ncbi:SIP domain-containing protein [Rhodococcus sp. NPDC060086]|uniref:SIP domain-containing protein n=1 Tax=Rhodococcus sp. NPDC060086 TaxID=3347055 RepID=UPI0036519FD6
MARSYRKQLVHPEVIRRATVLGTSDITAGMRRIVLGGPELSAFTRDGFDFPPLRSPGFDDFVRLFFPTESGEVVLPRQRERSVEWPRDPKPVTRNYTVRRHDPDSGELAIDFVTHETGIASSWGRRCRPGDTIDLLGPVRSGEAPDDVDWVLVVGDETALPAIARWLEEMPAGLDARVVVEVASADYSLDLPSAATVSLTRVNRGDRSAGDATALESAVRSVQWRDGKVFAWVAGESTSLRGIRRYLRNERSMPAEMVEITGYWRRSEVVTLADDPEVPDLAVAPPEPFEKLAERAEIVSPFVIRAANTLRIPHHVAEGARDLDELAARTGTDPRALAKFVRYLGTVEVLARARDGSLTLGEVGEAMLADEWVSNWLDFDGIEARVELSITGLVGTLRSGSAAVSAITGHTLDEDLEAHAKLADKHHGHIADEAAFLGSALAAEYPFTGLSRILVSGTGSGVVLGSVLGSQTELTATIVDMPSELDRIRGDIDPAVSERVSLLPQSILSPVTTGAFDAYLLLEATGRLQDCDLAMLLRNAIDSVAQGGKLVVVERLLDEGSDGAPLTEDAAEFDLLMLCMHGTGVRTLHEFTAVAADAGLGVTESRLVGWGIAVLDLQRRPSSVSS